MADALLQTLTIKLNAEVGNTKRKLNDVATSVEKLEEIGKKADWSVFEQIRTNLEGIAKIDFSNVADSLKDVVTAMKSLGISPKQVKNEPKLQTPKMENSYTTESPQEQSFNLADTSAKNYISILKDVSIATKQTDNNIKLVTKDVKIAGDEAKTSAPKWDKLIKSIKRITFYRMVRRAIQLIGQAITEGIQNLALFDSNFNNSMSEMLTSLTYFKNSIGVALAPIIEVVTPAVVMLLDGLASAFNAVGKALSYAFGSKEIVQAKKDTQDYAETLKKLKSITLGIDELNIINDKNKNDYFIKIEIDGEEKIDSVADKISNLGLLVGGLALLFSVNLKGALLKVGALLGSVKISLAGLITTFAGGIVTVSQFYDIMKNGLNWSNFAKLISGATIAVLGLQLAFHKLDVTLIGSTIAGIFAIVAGIKDMYENGITLQNAILTALGAITVALSLAWFAMKTVTGQALMLQLALHGLHTSFLSVTLAVGTLVAGVLAFVALFKKVQEGWGQMNFWQKLASVLGLVIIAVSTLVATVSAFLQQWHVFGIAVASGLIGSALAIGAITSAPHFAQGGFPEDGFFYANHSELVGQFSNGQTAVANNAQIVEGIKQGVMDAIAESGGFGSNQTGRDIVIQIDGREIGRASEKYEAQKGEKIFSGGYHYGY